MNIWNAIVTSSADPKRTSLAIKGALVMVAPAAMFFLGIDQATADSAIGGIITIVENILVIISIVMMLWGVGRKAKLKRWHAEEE